MILCKQVASGCGDHAKNRTVGVHMRLTFSNKLFFPDKHAPDLIRYAHHFRADADLYIRHINNGGRDWTLAFVARKSMYEVPKALRYAIIQDFRSYVSRRVNKNPNALFFKDFVDMARAVSL